MPFLEVSLEKKIAQFTICEEFVIDDGILILFGPSGVGKTTILDCLAGLRSPDRGRIRLNDVDLFSSKKQINIPTFQRRVGYVFQEYALFPHLSVKKNVTYSLGGNKKNIGAQFDVKDIMEMCHISHLQDCHPERLSGGEKQRVALARALMSEPDLLLLDEPLSSLDQELSNSLQEEIRKIQQLWEIPFVYVTHNQQQADFLGDRILYIEKVG